VFSPDRTALYYLLRNGPALSGIFERNHHGKRRGANPHPEHQEKSCSLEESNRPTTQIGPEQGEDTSVSVDVEEGSEQRKKSQRIA
jgi:hypothetical protein